MTGPLLAILLGGAPMAPPVPADWPVVLRPALVVATEEATGLAGAPSIPGPAEAVLSGEGACLRPYTLGRAIVARPSRRKGRK